jgi:hypothetical protein
VQGLDPGAVIATSSFEKLMDGVKTTISRNPIPTDSTESNTP